jgi:REP element-mobilizing transposase RayT
METTDKHIAKRHNKTLLLYHLVFPCKYRRLVLTPNVEQTLKEVCLNMAPCYEMNFLEIGSDDNHVHYLVQNIPSMSVSDMVKTIKSITARELFRSHPEIKKMLWGGNFWTSGFYANTVGQYGNEAMIRKYIANQGIPRYKTIYEGQLTLL